MSEESVEAKEPENAPVTRYRVAYAPHAQSALEGLDPALRNYVTEEVHRVSSVNPYTHGTALEGVRDRRCIALKGVTVTFWVTDIMTDAVEERILTVAQVVAAPESEPVLHAPGAFEEDEEEDEILLPAPSRREISSEESS